MLNENRLLYLNLLELFNEVKAGKVDYSLFEDWYGRVTERSYESGVEDGRYEAESEEEENV